MQSLMTADRTASWTRLGLSLAIAISLCLTLGCDDDDGVYRCEYAGQFYSGGQSFDALDGCNTCACDAATGEIICTMMACAPLTCEPADCPNMSQAPNYLCDDGETTAGPTPCELQEDGTCGWQMVQCPEEE